VAFVDAIASPFHRQVSSAEPPSNTVKLADGGTIDVQVHDPLEQVRYRHPHTTRLTIQPSKRPANPTFTPSAMSRRMVTAAIFAEVTHGDIDSGRAGAAFGAAGVLAGAG
jgi:hypothetical protein